jgi:hypothetical protein
MYYGCIHLYIRMVYFNLDTVNRKDKKGKNIEHLRVLLWSQYIWAHRMELDQQAQLTLPLCEWVIGLCSMETSQPDKVDRNEIIAPTLDTWHSRWGPNESLAVYDWVRLCVNPSWPLVDWKGRSGDPSYHWAKASSVAKWK